jgi:catechol 2,3-dioxygenase-like lactoylglutathione lyase family enzyme
MVELTVSDWPAAVDWYRDVLGLGLLLRVEADRFALFQAGPARLALKAGEAAPGGALLAFEVDDLSAWLKRLAGRGVAPEGPVKVSPEGYRQALLRGPDGQRLSLFEWCRGNQPVAGAPG